MLAASSMRTVSASTFAPRLTRTVTVPSVGVDGTSLASPPRRPDDQLGGLTDPVAGSAMVTSMTSPPTFAFSSSGRALGDDPAVVDDDDAVGQLVGFVQVLRREQHRRALGNQLADDAHRSMRLRGSSPVVGSSRKSTVG